MLNTWKEKVGAPIIVATILGAWVWLANVAEGQSDLESDHRVWEEKLTQIADDVTEIKVDIKALNTEEIAKIAEITKERLEAIEFAIKRQNCVLAGGPDRVPKSPVCRGIF